MSENSSLVCVSDYEKRALELLCQNARDYYKSGANDGQTLLNNVDDFMRIRLRPRMMVDVSQIKMETTILGDKIDFPICIAPTASQRMAHPDGEIANAKAAHSMNTCFVLSTIATTSAQELAEAVGSSLRWYQLYISRDRSITIEMVHRAEEFGYKALVLTVDTPTFGNRFADTRNKFSLPPHLRMANFDGLSALANTGMSETGRGSGLNYFSDRFFDHTVTWKDIAWLKSITRLPIVVKGIMTDFDAKNAVEAGCDAVIVSNHGGRQLDGVNSTIMALPEVVRAVAGRVEVYLDGGVRKGTDVLKALAMGAKAVFVGRPALYGLTVGGQEGVKHVLELLKKELKLAMQLSGVTDVNAVPRDLVMHESRLISRL